MPFSDFSFQSAAKINLGLNIQAKLADGYHQVETVMTKIQLFDQISVHWLEGRGEKNQLICQKKYVPNNSKNLVIQAFSLLQKKFKLPSAQFSLIKNIPVGAGLGGGSFNAGCLLKEFNQRLNLGLTPSELQKLALQLGADIPFSATNFASVHEINHGLSNLCQIELPPLPTCKIVLIVQNYNLSTTNLYHNFNQYQLNDQTSLCQALNDYDLIKICHSLNNDFEKYVFSKHNELLGVKKQLINLGALGVGLTGKGPTLFAIFPIDSQPNLSYLQNNSSKLITHLLTNQN